MHKSRRNLNDLRSIRRLLFSERDEESLAIRPSPVIKEAPIGNERARLFRQYQNHLDQIADSVNGVPEAEIDIAIDEALRHAAAKPNDRHVRYDYFCASNQAVERTRP